MFIPWRGNKTLIADEAEVHHVVQIVEKEEFIGSDPSDVVLGAVVSYPVSDDVDFAFVARDVSVDDQDIALFLGSIGIGR